MAPSDPPTDRLGLVYVPGRSSLYNIWHNFWRYKWSFFFGAIFLLITNYATFEIPQLIGDAVAAMRDAVLSKRLDTQHIIYIAWGIIGLAFLAGGARVVSRAFIFNAGRDIEFDIRNALYEKLTLLNPTYFASIRTGDLTSRVTNDVSSIRVMYAISFLHLINTVVAYAVALEKMLSMNVLLTVIALAPFPFLLLMIKHFVQQLFKYTIVSQSELSNISSAVQENLSGMPVVKTYRLEKSEIKSFKRQSDRLVEANMMVAKARAGLDATSTLVAGVSSLLALVGGAYMLETGRIDLAQFVTFNGYMTALALPTTAMGWVFSCWNRGRASYDRIMTVLSAPIEIQSPKVPAKLPPRGESCGAVKLQNVTFAYNDEVILHGITLDIAAGSRVAIVGRTGAGKSTLAKLLVRLYDPQNGKISLDGVDLRNADLRQLRSEIGVVAQNPFLFSMTVRDNIRFGIDAMEEDSTLNKKAPTTSLLDPEKEATTAQRIAEAVEIAGLSGDLSSFREGLETIVGERGISLSGGQKQRATIARALLVDPRLLILDDALSAVDAKTESQILDHLEVVMKNRTTILITHRFNALDRVDKILVMERGRIIAEGTHQQLLAQGGLYLELWQKQQLSDELSQTEVDP